MLATYLATHAQALTANLAAWYTLFINVAEMSQSVLRCIMNFYGKYLVDFKALFYRLSPFPSQLQQLA
jgi:hypothetical protein